MRDVKQDGCKYEHDRKAQIQKKQEEEQQKMKEAENKKFKEEQEKQEQSKQEKKPKIERATFIQQDDAFLDIQGLSYPRLIVQDSPPTTRIEDLLYY